MDKKLSLKNIAEATKAKVFTEQDLSDIAIQHISTDSREIKANSVFIALKGEKHDAHEYLEEAVKQEPEAIIIDKENLVSKYEKLLPVLLVKDTNKALLDISRLYRDSLETKIIALTGSVGKTSTKNLLSQALATDAKVYKTRKNNNNEFGVAYTLLEIPSVSEYAVVECGMDRLGQIEKMSLASHPDLCLITNIGTSHIEFLNSRLNILKAKSEILKGAKEGAPLVILAEDPYLLKLAEETLDERPVIFLDTDGMSQKLRTKLEEDKKLEPVSAERINALANKASQAKVKNLFSNVQSGTRYKLKEFSYDNEGINFKVFKATPNEEFKLIAQLDLKAFGPQLCENILFSLAVSDILGISLEKVVSSFNTNLELEASRQEIHKLEQGNLIIDDAYNASAESMKSAFVLSEHLLAQPEYEKSVAILGGVNELGSYEQAIHMDIARAIAKSSFSEVLLQGPEAKKMQAVILENNSNIKVKTFANNAETIEYLKANTYQKTIFLLKASRTYKFEEISEALKDIYKLKD